MKKRLDETHIFRVIACMSVIIVHVSAIPLFELPKEHVLLGLFVVLNRFFKFTTPAFLFLSGLTLFHRYKDREFEYFAFIKRRLQTTYVPYIWWNLVYYFCFIIGGYYAFSPIIFLDRLATGNMNYHFYFVVIIIQFYIIFGILRYGFLHFNAHLVLACLGITNILFMRYAQFPFSDRFFMGYVFFFGLGCYAALHLGSWKRILSKYMGYLIALYLVIASQYSYQYYQYEILAKPIHPFTVSITWFVFSLISILMVYAVALRLLDRDARISEKLKNLSKSSFDIYLSHPLILGITDTILEKAGLISPLFRFTVEAIVLFVLGVPGIVKYTMIKEQVFYIWKQQNSLCPNLSFSKTVLFIFSHAKDLNRSSRRLDAEKKTQKAT